ncbi:MAG: hypothetical protein ACYCYF_14300, partial [Anaerolineae bacterium]
KLSTVIRGDLWDEGRLCEIWLLNTGSYDRYLDVYAYNRGTTLTQDLQITNPTRHAYVYAYVWNNGAGETYLLDSASSQGQAYTVRWEVSATAVSFEGAYETRVSQIAGVGAPQPGTPVLSDAEPLAMGVLFADDPTLGAYEAYERRFWFALDHRNDGAMTVVLPALEWYNGEAPGGYWREVDIDPVLAPLTR